MILRIYVIAIGAFALLAGFLLLAESPFSSPGQINKRHAAQGLDCRACHTPFQGASMGCESCHGVLAPENAHRDAGFRCAECHPEHRGATVSLNAGARLACGGCHAHSAIEDVASHAIAGTMMRPVDAGSPERAGADALRSFSHLLHFEEAGVTDDPNCKSCHFVGEKAEALGGAEQLILWSACEECHDDWQAAGFAEAARSADSRVALELERFERVAFSHSEEHLEVDCEDCHTGVREAEAIAPDGSDGGPGELPIARLATCFGCHVHQPEGVSWAGPATASAESDYAPGSNVDCAGCHQFHGKGDEAEIVAAQSEREPPPRGWDLWYRAADLSVTPWLLLFLGLSGTSWVFVWRRLPDLRRTDLVANSDVAPQRVAEVPVLSPFNETSVAGLYIIGELAGVPLVNRAMKSGFDVIDIIENRLGGGRDVPGDDDLAPEDRVLDLLIAGSGPAGLGAATRAQSAGLSYVVCEKSTAAATIRDYPRAKIIQAAPVDIPDYGSFFQEDDESKDALVRRWEDIINRTGVVMREREEVVDVRAHDDGGFVVEIAGSKQYRANNVVLAVGMRGTPRRLRVDGETPERVAYNLIDAAEYRGQDILVVGGGNAAVEAALALSQPELLNRVQLAIRGPVLKGITPQNSSDVDAAAAEGQLEIIPSASMTEIREGFAILQTGDEERVLPNDKIFALIGAELPLGFLRKIGVKLSRKGWG